VGEAGRRFGRYGSFVARRLADDGATEREGYGESVLSLTEVQAAVW
jgi:hypothetical protein